MPVPFTFGSAPRNSVIGPGFSTTDIAFARTWSIGGRRQIEARWEVFPQLKRDFPQPQWDGNRLDGRRILIHEEQGFGDTMQFVRFASLVAARPRR